MVWLNEQHINESVKPGYIGGSMCTCITCKRDRMLKSLSKQANLSDYDNLSDEAKNLIFWLLKDITNLRWVFSVTVEWAYDTAIKNYGYTEAPEGKEKILEITELFLKHFYS